MDNINNNNLLDLGSEPEEFDPFATDDDTAVDVVKEDKADTVEQVPEQVKTELSNETTNPTDATTKVADKKETDKQGFADKPPVFEYAGATENIDDSSKTFDELRIEKSADFPELEDGKRVSWTVEYGKITKTVPDPKGMSIGKMKSDIETSKEFEDSLKKRGADKNPTCKVKPRVTAQSKGNSPTYKGVFTNLDNAEAAGKVISIVPGAKMVMFTKYGG